MSIGLSWRQKAVCSPVDAGLFTSDEKPSREQITRLGMICAACPVSRECAEYALHSGALGFFAGVWVPNKGTGRQTARLALERKAVV